GDGADGKVEQRARRTKLHNVFVCMLPVAESPDTEYSRDHQQQIKVYIHKVPVQRTKLVHGRQHQVGKIYSRENEKVSYPSGARSGAADKAYKGSQNLMAYKKDKQHRHDQRNWVSGHGEMDKRVLDATQQMNEHTKGHRQQREDK